MGRVSLVNQVVGVQGQGEQRHGKDLKFGSPKIIFHLVQFVLVSLDLYLCFMIKCSYITCHIIK